MRFPYYEIEVSPYPGLKRKTKILRPIIPVVLIYSRAIVGYEALIDSGADYNIFEAGIAQILGIRLTSGNKRMVAGIGEQKIKGYEHRIGLRIQNREYQTKVIFSKEIPSYSFGVLGNRGFFDRFKVNFDYRKKFIDLV